MNNAFLFICSSETSPIPSPVSPSSTITPPALPPKQRSRTNQTVSSPPRIESPTEPPPPPVVHTPQTKALPDLLEHAAVETKNLENENCENETNPCDIDLMEELDVDKYLVWKPQEEEGPDIRGGTIDALIIQATKATKNGGE